MKWRSRPSNHKINRITPIITSNLNILTSFYLSSLLTWLPSKVRLFGYYTSLPDNNACVVQGTSKTLIIGGYLSTSRVIFT
jgi:hypothetical protein